MKREIQNGCEILSDGVGRVWVNGKDGAAIARFSVKAGRDIHRTLDEQRSTGEECLDCSPDTSWEGFVASMAKHHGITIKAKHRPRG